MTDYDNQEERDRAEALMAAGTQAPPDTEEKLARLHELQARLRVDPRLKAEYEALRNELVRELATTGPRWFLDGEGHKHLAHPVEPEETVLDVELAIALAKQGKIDPATLDLIAPRKQNLEGLRKAITKKRLTNRQIADLVSFRPKTGHVGYLDPESGADG